MSHEAEARAEAYRLNQATIARKRELVLQRLQAPAAAFTALVERYRPIREYQMEQSQNGREDPQPIDNGVTVN
jgi:hypothetical protein